ncbi:hypothetical protein HMPREF3187_00978 [Aerococcus christensenii]|uniref:Uncharacterized protein n=1 Tax=Aerococcus christensenii TaxID=87541 RepID=A0A133XZ25_9LACT|nr:hypothetical protein HMPREF3187_00978 [Aerococcus christensenii]
MKIKQSKSYSCLKKNGTWIKQKATHSLREWVAFFFAIRCN